MLDLDCSIRKYIEDHSSALPDFYEQILRSTHLNTTHPEMSSDELQGRFLALLSTIISPSLIVEVGTFTAYATVFLAKGLPPEGRLITIEKNIDLRPLIERHLEWSKMQDKIDVRFGDALHILKNIDDPIDMIFIDAVKREYTAYYNIIIDKIRSGGLIIADNTLWKGQVLHGQQNNKTQSIHEFNQMISKDIRVEALLLPYRDGLTIMRKK